MSRIAESYKGSYEVSYALPGPSGEPERARATCKRVDIVGPPWRVQCFAKKKATSPVLVVPWEYLVGIRQMQDEEEAPDADQ